LATSGKRGESVVDCRSDVGTIPSAISMNRMSENKMKFRKGITRTTKIIICNRNYINKNHYQRCPCYLPNLDLFGSCIRYESTIRSSFCSSKRSKSLNALRDFHASAASWATGWSSTITVLSLLFCEEEQNWEYLERNSYPFLVNESSGIARIVRPIVLASAGLAA
jgi:hypothetical protein